MGHDEIIHRHLTEAEWERSREDLRIVARVARRFRPDLLMSLRRSRATLYYQGNVLCTVNLVPDTTRSRKKYPKPYNVAFGLRFVSTGKGQRWEPLPGWDLQIDIDDAAGQVGRDSGGYRYYNLDGDGLETVLSDDIVRRIMVAVRAVDYGGEIGFEQLLVAENPPRPEFMIIDRQVADSSKKKRQMRMDLLGLRRTDDSEMYRLVVMELKLGGNPSVAGEMVDQARAYMRHLKGPVLKAYAHTYEEVYRQLYWLGLMSRREMPERISIDPTQVSGMIVVGYADEETQRGIEKLEGKHQDIEFRVLELRLG